MMSEQQEDTTRVCLVHLKYEDDLKYEKNLKHDKDLKYEDDIKYRDNLKSEVNQKCQDVQKSSENNVIHYKTSSTLKGTYNIKKI